MMTNFFCRIIFVVYIFIFYSMSIFIFSIFLFFAVFLNTGLFLLRRYVSNSSWLHHIHVYFVFVMIKKADISLIYPNSFVLNIVGYLYSYLLKIFSGDGDIVLIKYQIDTARIAYCTYIC